MTVKYFLKWNRKFRLSLLFISHEVLSNVQNLDILGTAPKNQGEIQRNCDRKRPEIGR